MIVACSHVIFDVETAGVALVSLPENPYEMQKKRFMSLRSIAMIPQFLLIALFAKVSILGVYASDGLQQGAGTQNAGRWVLSYDAGYLDEQGNYAGGSEIMHLAAHKGKLFAANGYWMDGRWEIPSDGQKQSAQVLRLDSSDGVWQVDLDTGKENGLGLEFMKANILKSVTFRYDGKGQPLADPES